MLAGAMAGAPAKYCMYFMSFKRSSLGGRRGEGKYELALRRDCSWAPNVHTPIAMVEDERLGGDEISARTRSIR